MKAQQCIAGILQTAARKGENKSPAFTAAATYLVTSFAGAAFAATAVGIFVTSVVAVGLAVATSKLINGSGRQGGGTAQDPGVRVQLPPATNNKVPVVYGSAFQKGTVTDARISNSNKTMTYVLILSEKTQTGTFSIGDIYWNDQKLIFGTGSESHIVKSSIDQNGAGTSNTNFNGLIRVRVYSGNVDSGSQIFPVGNAVGAMTVIPPLDPANTNDSTYRLNDLVFAVVQIDYSSEKGVTGLAQMTFQVQNSLKNPGSVWYDYMTSRRYGPGYDSSIVDTNWSINSSNSLSLFSISNQVPPNQFLSNGTTPSSQVRYEINGVLSTGDTIKNNLDRICLSCNAWTSYDYTIGKWKIVMNRSATSTELANAFEFDDDNILGEVGVTATNLEDLFNQLEVEFASRKIRDQNDYYRAAISQDDRNDLEPDNTMNLRLDMVNNALHAARVGLVEIKGSRADLIITFRADYSAIQCQAGDVVKISNSVYGFSNKLFRLTKIREIEDDEGMLSVEITALEYSSVVYTDESLTDSPDTPGSGVPVFGGSGLLPAPGKPFFTDVTVNPEPVPGQPTPPPVELGFTANTVIDPNSGPLDTVEWFISGDGINFNYAASEFSPGGFAPGTTVSRTFRPLSAGNYWVRARTREEFRTSALSESSDQLTLS